MDNSQNVELIFVCCEMHIVVMLYAVSNTTRSPFCEALSGQRRQIRKLYLQQSIICKIKVKINQQRHVGKYFVIVYPFYLLQGEE